MHKSLLILLFISVPAMAQVIKERYSIGLPEVKAQGCAESEHVIPINKTDPGYSVYLDIEGARGFIALRRNKGSVSVNHCNNSSDDYPAGQATLVVTYVKSGSGKGSGNDFCAADPVWGCLCATWPFCDPALPLGVPMVARDGTVRMLIDNGTVIFVPEPEKRPKRLGEMRRLRN